MTENEKRIYNAYLATTRSIQNKPFRIRKDFSKFPEDKLYHVQRIANFFRRFPHINIEDYFKAPFIIYPEETETFGLDFFSSMRAIRIYTLYMKKLDSQNPDNPETLEIIKKGLKFIGFFCIENEISVDNYLTHKEYAAYSWLKHYKERHISIYCLLGFDNFTEILYNISKDLRELFLNDLEKDLVKYKMQFMKSKTAKKLVNRGLVKMREVITYV
jgi:hypothetical protein